MSRAVITIHSDAQREQARLWLAKAPLGTRLEFKAAKRSLPQNARMWAMLTDLATQLCWHGKHLKPDEWKLVMLDGLKRELRIVPNINGTGFVNLGRSSADLSKEEMGNLMSLIEAFGAQHGVVFNDPMQSEPWPDRLAECP